MVCSTVGSCVGGRVTAFCGIERVDATKGLQRRKESQRRRRRGGVVEGAYVVGGEAEMNERLRVGGWVGGVDGWERAV